METRNLFVSSGDDFAMSQINVEVSIKNGE
jgi:hypothetical protein